MQKDRNWWRNITELQRQLYRQLYKKSCYEFTKEFWNEADPQPFVDGVVVQIFCELFQYYTRFWQPFYKDLDDENLEREIEEYRQNGYIVIDVRKENKKNVSIAIPPRHSKTMCWSVCSPSWGQTNYPLKSAAISHTSGLSNDINKKRQKIMNSEKFKFFFPEIVLETNTTQVLKTTQSGELFSLPRESSTGFGADILGLDDIVNAAQARRDKQEMENAWAFMTDTLPSRVNDMSRYVILNVAQRLAPNDIEGRIRDNPSIASQYSFVTLPAQFSKKTIIVCPITGTIIKFEEGDYLWPERFGDYSSLRAQVGETVWQAQYLQNPQYADTNVVKESMIVERDITDVPTIEQAEMIYGSHDFPVKDKDVSDFLGSMLFYKIGANIYIKDVLEKRMPFTEEVQYVKNLDDTYPGIIQVIEDKANGTAVMDQLKDVVPAMQAFQPGTASKTQRLESATVYMSNVIFVRDKFNPKTGKFELNDNLLNLKKKLLAFPYLDHDDIVDAFSMGILFVYREKRWSVYARSFNNELNTCKDDAIPSLKYSAVFFNKEGDTWKVADIAIQYGTNTKIFVRKEVMFKGTVNEGIIELKKFAPNQSVFMDCSYSEALYGIYSNGVSVDRYEIEDFDKSVLDLSTAFATRKVVVCTSCKGTLTDIDMFKYDKSKDDNNMKYKTQKDGYVACLRTAINYFGGIV